MDVQERCTMWAEWSATFFKAESRPMSDTQSRVFVTVMMLELVDNTKGIEDLLEAIRDTFTYKVLDKRAEFVGLNLSTPAKIFLCCLASTPGDLVMYIYALRYWQLTNADAQVTVGLLSTVFPSGFLTAEALSSLWAKQKIKLSEGTQNLLDTLSKSGLQSIADWYSTHHQGLP